MNRFIKAALYALVFVGGAYILYTIAVVSFTLYMVVNSL